MDPQAMARALSDMGGYTPEQAWRGRYREPQGGVLDTLPDDAPIPSDKPDRNRLAAALNQGLGLVNHYTMGVPATLAGLVNAAIPGQPFGDMWSAVQSGRDAADEFAANGRGARDLLSLPDAFAGHIGSAPHVPAGARITAEGAAQAGRGIDNALTSAVRAIPDNEVGSAGGKLSAPSPAGIRAYHGSPHDFSAERLVRYPDGRTEYVVGSPGELPPIPQGASVVKDFPLGRFREDKAFTGEGAQVYGYGAAYLAENEGVAGTYRTAGDKDLRLVQRDAVDLLDSFGGDREKAIASAELKAKKFGDSVMTMTSAKHQKNIADAIRSGKEVPGRMYEVRINADPEHFLDWDKPLSKQSEKVQEFLASNPRTKSSLDFSNTHNDKNAGDLMWSFGEGGSHLKEAGIPGIKYLDQGSRGVPLEFASKAEAEAAGYRNGGHDIAPGRYAPYDAGGMYVSDPKGTRNYVVFDDKLIEIMKKYGIAGTMVAGGGMAVSSSDVEAHPALIPMLMGAAGLMAGGLSNSARDAELMLNRQSSRLYDYAPKPGMAGSPEQLAAALRKQ